MGRLCTRRRAFAGFGTSPLLAYAIYSGRIDHICFSRGLREAAGTQKVAANYHYRSQANHHLTQGKQRRRAGKLEFVCRAVFARFQRLSRILPCRYAPAFEYPQIRCVEINSSSHGRGAPSASASLCLGKVSSRNQFTRLRTTPTASRRVRTSASLRMR